MFWLQVTSDCDIKSLYMTTPEAYDKTNDKVNVHLRLNADGFGVEYMQSKVFHVFCHVIIDSSYVRHVMSCHVMSSVEPRAKTTLTFAVSKVSVCAEVSSRQSRVRGTSSLKVRPCDRSNFHQVEADCNNWLTILHDSK